MLGYEDGGLAGADYNTVRCPGHEVSPFAIPPLFLQVLRDVVLQLRLARADVVVSFFPCVYLQIKTL
jgi:hypothetical protein